MGIEVGKKGAEEQIRRGEKKLGTIPYCNSTQQWTPSDVLFL